MFWGETTLTEILVKFLVVGAVIGIYASGNERARTFPDAGAAIPGAGANRRTEIALNKLSF
jgi:hypothetical protein